MDTMALSVEYFGLSHIGYVRKDNEDVWLKAAAKPFFALADGMGGHQAGEVAASEAVRILCTEIERIKKIPESEERAVHLLKEAVQKTNEQVHRHSLEHAFLEGMGTTLVCLWLSEKKAYFAHVGDSRLYLYRKKLERLTHDHSLREEWLAKGHLPLPSKNILTRAIGTNLEVEPDVGSLDIEPNDLFLLCSDGLTDSVCDEEIFTILKKGDDLQDTAQELVEAALKKGGSDNITVFLIRSL